jgi:hypothetical protein
MVSLYRVEDRKVRRYKTLYETLEIKSLATIHIDIHMQITSII